MAYPPPSPSASSPSSSTTSASSSSPPPSPSHQFFTSDFCRLFDQNGIDPNDTDTLLFLTESDLGNINAPLRYILQWRRFKNHHRSFTEPIQIPSSRPPESTTTETRRASLFIGSTSSRSTCPETVAPTAVNFQPPHAPTSSTLAPPKTPSTPSSSASIGTLSFKEALAVLPESSGSDRKSAVYGKRA